MSNNHLRERKVASNGASRDKLEAPRSIQESERGLSVLDILRIIAGLVMLNCALSYFVTNDSYLWGWRPWFFQPKLVARWWEGPVLLTDAELAHYDGTDPALPIYLGLNGTIYDVTAGRRIYGPGGSYHILAAKDAARSYITGCIEEDSTPDLRGAEWTFVPLDVPHFDDVTVKVDKEVKMRREQELRKARKAAKEALDSWVKLFSGASGKDYFEAGKIVREPGWLENLPMRKLCDNAVKKRPKAASNHPVEKAEDVMGSPRSASAVK